MVTSQQSSELGNEVPVEGRQIEQQAINPTATSKEISAEQPQQGEQIWEEKKIYCKKGCLLLNTKR